MADGGAKTWVLTGSLDNYRATAERDAAPLERALRDAAQLQRA